MIHLNILKHTWPPSIYQSQDLFQWWTRWCQLLSTGPVMPLRYHGVSQAVSLVTRVGVGYEAWLQRPNIHEPHETQCIENLKITSIDKFRWQQSIKTSVWIKNQGTKITASARNRKATPTLGMGDLGKRLVFKTYQTWMEMMKCTSSVKPSDSNPGNNSAAARATKDSHCGRVRQDGTWSGGSMHPCVNISASSCVSNVEGPQEMVTLVTLVNLN